MELRLRFADPGRQILQTVYYRRDIECIETRWRNVAPLRRKNRQGRGENCAGVFTASATHVQLAHIVARTGDYGRPRDMQRVAANITRPIAVLRETGKRSALKDRKEDA